MRNPLSPEKDVFCILALKASPLLRIRCSLIKSRRKALIALILINLAIVATAQSEVLSGDPQPKEIDSLVILNNAMRAEYSRAKAQALSKIGPLIMIEGANAVLVQNGTRTEAEILPPIYQALKAVAHIPFAVFLMFGQSDFQPLSDAKISELRDYRKLIVDAAKTLRGFSDAQLQRQQEIIGESLAFLDDAIEKRQVTKQQLDDFARKMNPILLANVDEATKAEIDALHSHVMEWRHKLSQDEWQKLHVLIMSAHMPRDRELTVQYFERALNEPFEGRRIVYAEGLYEEPKAMDLLGTHIVDGSAGEAFFGNFMRMHRDLLSDAAAAYIQTLKFDE
jgi:hypothetical protein